MNANSKQQDHFIRQQQRINIQLMEKHSYERLMSLIYAKRWRPLLTVHKQKREGDYISVYPTFGGYVLQIPSSRRKHNHHILFKFSASAKSLKTYRASTRAVYKQLIKLSKTKNMVSSYVLCPSVWYFYHKSLTPLIIIYGIIEKGKEKQKKYCKHGPSPGIPQACC